MCISNLPDAVAAKVAEVEVNNNDSGDDKYQSHQEAKKCARSIEPGQEAELYAHQTEYQCQEARSCQQESK